MNPMSEWISVKDRLPEKLPTKIKIPYLCDGESIRVLLYSAKEEKEYAGYYDYQLRRFFTVDDSVIGGVTHWMPLPEPPKED